MARAKDPKIEMLSEVTLFRALSKKDLQNVARHVDEVERGQGEVLTRQGDRGVEMLVIVEGAAKVERDGKKVATLGAGDVVGEMSLVDREPRSATVTATEDCRLLVMSHNDFGALMDETPGFAKKVLTAVVKRLREADRQLVG